MYIVAQRLTRQAHVLDSSWVTVDYSLVWRNDNDVTKCNINYLKNILNFRHTVLRFKNYCPFYIIKS